MKKFKLISIHKNPEWINSAAEWFSNKWSVPKEAYLESMNQSLGALDKVPSWFVVLNEKDEIIAGAGIIENDFHDRKDLTPNLCALFVEEAYRKQGIAGFLLDNACKEMKKAGLKNLYLITDHTEFYEKYGWSFLTMVNCDGDEQARMYVKSTES